MREFRRRPRGQVLRVPRWQIWKAPVRCKREIRVNHLVEMYQLFRAKITSVGRPCVTGNNNLPRKLTCVLRWLVQVRTLQIIKKLYKVLYVVIEFQSPNT